MENNLIVCFNARFLVGLVMVRAIREYLNRTGIKVGFKPAGGIRTAKDSLVWLSLMKEELGNDYVKVSLTYYLINFIFKIEISLSETSGQAY